MNRTTTPRQWALVVATFVCLFSTQQAQGQCSDFAGIIGTPPYAISLPLDASGNAILNDAVLSGIFVKDAACQYWLSQDSLGAYSPAPVNFDCSDVNTTQTWFIRVGGNPLIGDDGGPGNTIVRFTVTVFDNTPASTAGPAIPAVVMNSDADGSGDCTLTDVFFNSGATNDISISFDLFPVSQNFYYDNCPDNLRITWQLSGATVRAETNALGSFIQPEPILAPDLYDAGLDTFRVGVTTVTYRIYDDVVPLGPNNPLVITATVTVVDNEAPSVTCPSNMNVGTDAGVCTFALDTIPVYSDNCEVVNLVWSAPGATPNASPVSGINRLTATFPVGTTTVTFEVEDPAGLTDMCSFDVTVFDDELPVLSCPANDTVSAADFPSCVYTTVGAEFDPLSQSDNCGIVTLFNNWNGMNTLNGYAFNLGLNNIVWTAEDAAANAGTCSFFVTVIDDSAPIVSSTITTYYPVAVTPGDCSKAITFDRPNFINTIVDDCQLVDWTQGVAVVNGTPDPGILSGVPAYTPFDVFGLFPVTTTFPVGTTLIPYYFTDLSGNVDSIVIEFFVEENILPTAKCKAGTVTLPLAANGQATLTTGMVDDGSFDNCVLDTMYLSQSAFDCSHLPGTHIVTLTVEDAVGNTATCTVTVDVIDNIAPQVLCPGNQTVTTNLGCQTNNIAGIGMSLGVSPLAPGQYFDNCTGSTVTWQLSGATTGSGAGSVPGSQAFNTGVTNVTYTVADISGNNAVCNFSINVTDNTPPTWDGNGPAHNDTITVNANLGGCLAQYSWTVPTFTDACTPPVTVTPPAQTPGASFPFGFTAVTYTAKDGAGNVRIHTFVVRVVDTQAPNAQCKNITTYLNGAGTTGITAPQVDNLSTDNCFFTYTSPDASYNCTNLGPNNYTLQITDGSGNTATCVAVVTVADTIKPVANCASIPTINLNASGNFSLAATTVNNGSTDNTFPLCNLSYAISVEGSAFASSFNFNCSLLGNRVLTLRVTDAAGNTATCSQIVLVRDVTPPTIVAPANTTINCDASSAPANTGTFSGVTDNCDPAPTVVQLADVTVNVNCPNSYTINRTWRVTDVSGNSATTSHSIVVRDVQAPVINIQDTFHLQTVSAAFCSAPLTMQLTSANATDNCTTNFANLSITYTVDYPTPSYGFVDVLVPTPGATVLGGGGAFPVGTTAVTWRVTDQCGNTATKTVYVKVTDVHGPAFSPAYSAANCGKAYVLPNTTGACSNLFAWPRPNAGTNDVTDCLTFSVTEHISDSSVTKFLNLTNQFNYNTMSPFGIFPTAQFPVGITTVSYVATDANGNKSTCSFTIEIEDTEAPVLTCPPNQTILATCPTAQVPSYINQVGIADNCGGNVQVTQDYAPGTTLGSIFPAPNPPADSSTFTITMIGTDGYNNDTCSFTVMLLDGDAPIPTIDSLPDLIDSCGTLIVFAPSALDPCNPMADTIYGTPSAPVGSFLNTNPPSYQLNPGSYVITWAYNDGNGNVSTQPQNITVLNDVFPPVAICVANLTVNLDPVTGKAPVTTTMLNLGSFDPNMCGPLSFSVSPDTATCAHVGPNPATFTLTVRDLKGNPAICTTAVTVRDITAPILSGAPANLTIEACDSIPAAPQLTAFDACAGTYLVSASQVSNQNPINGVNKYRYTITRTWTTADASGNTAVVTRTIEVFDTKKPVFSANAPDTVMVTTDPNRQTCDDTVSVNILPFVSDCATGVDLKVTNNADPADGGNLSAIFNVGTTVVTFTAKDTTGNTQTHQVTVIVKDGTPPTAVCINGVSASLQPSGTVVVNTAQFNNNSSDNCPDTLDLRIQRLDELPLAPPSKTLTYDCSDADGVTQHPVKLFVADIYGNMSMCETFIVIQDNVDPTITLCPPSKTVLCTDALSTQDHGMALVTDNCPDSLMVSFSDAVVPDTSGQYCYKVERVWLVVDLAQNTAACLQTFNVLDTVAPILSQYPPDVTISCSQNLTPPTNVTATDNCSNFVGVTFVQDTIDIAQGLCGKYSYTIQRTRTAVDDCGNVESHTNTITVMDDAPPSFPGLPDTVTVQSVNFPTNDSCAVPVSLNLAQFIVDCAPISELVVTNTSPFGNGGLNAGGNYTVGTYNVYIAATDPCGNVGQDSVVVIVIDNSKPVAICETAVVSLGSDGTASITAAIIDDGKSTDNCGIDTMYLDVYTFDCGNLGNNPVVLTVVDVNGNVNTCSTSVLVTLGNNVGFNLDATSTPETIAGSNDGTATATATGGSGNFTFEWSTMDTGSTITGLPPGIYYVTATDANSGCIQVDSVIVQAGAKLTIIAGNAAGSQGEVVQVPVSVDNFKAMIGMSFSMHVTNPVVGTIQGGTPTGALPGVLTLNKVGNDLTVFWVGNGTPLDLPNGTVVFNLNVQLGTAPVGSTSPVTIDGTPTGLSFQRDSAGIITATMANLVPGMVMIDSLAANDLNITGTITKWSGNGTPVPDVVVDMTGMFTGQDLTDSFGEYGFAVPSSASNLVVTPTKSVTSMFSAGINVGDLLAIQFHAANVTLLPNPYQWVAGDVNNNGMVDLVDYLLVRQIILGLPHYSNGAPDWKFIPSLYTFPTPNPLSAPFPQSSTFNCCVDTIMDFKAVRMGDVTGDAPVNNIINDVQNRSGDVFRFRLNEQSVRAGELISVPFRANDFTARQAYQMTIDFDPNVLELADVQPGALPNFGLGNFSMNHVADGHLPNLWVGAEPLTLPEGEVLFTLTFRVLKNSGSLSDVLRPTSAVTEAFALNPTGGTMSIEFEFGSALNNGNVDKTTFELYQNRPNPFRHQTTIGFRLPQADRVVLRIFGVDGRLVKTITGDYAQGMNAITVPVSEIGAPGIYWYELETPTHSDRKKMILID